MERVWSALPDARDAEIERLQEESADRYRALRNHADETARLRLENERLRKALLNVSVHTAHANMAPDQLHVDLLTRISEITRAALAGKEPTHD